MRATTSWIRSESTTANITAKHITGAFTASDKVYDTTNSATVLTRSVVGAVSGDDVTLTGGTATFSDKTVANGKTVTLTGASLSGADMTNYVLDSVATTTASIRSYTGITHNITHKGQKIKIQTKHKMDNRKAGNGNGHRKPNVLDRTTCNTVGCANGKIR